ncbi:MAG: hypothetical protein AAB542_00930 [Patescibacteria group bacterium]
MKDIQRKNKLLKQKLAAPSTKGDIEEMGPYIVGAIAKTLEEYATKKDINDLKTELKSDIKSVEGKIDGLGGDISDLRRRVRDLETDTITRREFDGFKAKVLPQ